MDPVDAIGHVGYLAIAIGMFLIARQNLWGWIGRIIGEAIWIGVGFALGMTSIWAWGFFFIAIDLYAFYNWRKKALDKRT